MTVIATDLESEGCIDSAPSEDLGFSRFETKSTELLTEADQPKVGVLAASLTTCNGSMNRGYHRQSDSKTTEVPHARLSTRPPGAPRLTGGKAWIRPRAAETVTR